MNVWLPRVAAAVCMVLGTMQTAQGSYVTAGLGFTAAFLLQSSSRYEKQLDERRRRQYRD